MQTTKLTFQSIRSDQCFDLFWNYLETRRLSIDVPDPTLPRRRKVLRRFETGEAAPEYLTNVKDHYRRIYYQAIDLITTAIANRFDQKGFQMLQKLETVLTTNTTESIELEEAIKEITSFYGAADLNSDRLQTQLHALHTSSGSPLVGCNCLP